MPHHSDLKVDAILAEMDFSEYIILGIETFHREDSAAERFQVLKAWVEALRHPERHLSSRGITTYLDLCEQEMLVAGICPSSQCDGFVTAVEGLEPHGERMLGYVCSRCGPM